MRKNNNINSTGFALLIVSFAPLFYFLLGTIFTKFNWNPIWIIILSIFLTIISIIIMEKIDDKRNNK